MSTGLASETAIPRVVEGPRARLRIGIIADAQLRAVRLNQVVRECLADCDVVHLSQDASTQDFDLILFAQDEGALNKVGPSSHIRLWIRSGGVVEPKDLHTLPAISDSDLAQVLPIIGPCIASMIVERRKSDEEIAQLRSALSDIRESQASIDGDLVEAKKLQQSLLRDRGFALGAVELSLFLQSSGHVGGDLVGHFPIDGQRVGFFAIDVSGHGITSALMAARLAGYLSAGSAQANIALAEGPKGPVPRDPAEVVTEFNALVLEELETEHYFTLLLGHIDTHTGQVRACQAGHPHPVVIRADGAQHMLGQGGLPVGLIPGADYETFVVDLADGDRLIILSDGFIEAELPTGAFLGEDGLEKLLSETCSLPVNRVLEMLVWRLSQLCGDAAFNDDLSGVVVSFSPD